PATTKDKVRHKYRHGPGFWASRIALYALLAVFLVPVLFPVYYVFAGAIMEPRELSNFPPQLLPTGLHTDNLTGALESVPLLRMYANSLVMAAIITASQLLTSALAAYAFVFLRFRGSAVVFALFLSTLMVPAEATFIPNYLTLTGWGLGDTYAGLVLPFLAYAFGTFLLRQSLKPVAGELYVAARVDGRGQRRVLGPFPMVVRTVALCAEGRCVVLSGWNMGF